MRPERGERRLTFLERARRAQIIAATERTIARVGYAGASLARIAAEAEISKSVISYHFEGKETLLRQTAETFFTEAYAAMSAALADQETALGRLEAWITGQVDYFVAHRERFLAAVAIAMNLRQPDGSLVFAASLNEEITAIAQILREGIATGELRAIDPEAYALILSRLTEAILGPWIADPGVPVGEHTATALDLIRHAILQEPP